MDLEVKGNNPAVFAALNNAQLIANTFAKGLEDNACLLISTVSLNQRIDDITKDIEDLVDPVYKDPLDIIDTVVIRPGSTVSPIVAEAIKNSKDKCFTCKLKLPKVKFEGDLSFSISDLKAHLQLYTELFDSVQKFNPCQAIELFKDQCIPDILKLITLLLTAYLAIQAARKIGSLSISVFIKGIISALLGKLIANLKVSVDLSQTGLNCFIEYVEKLSKAIPTTDNIISSITSEQVIGLLGAMPTPSLRSLMAIYLPDRLEPEDGIYYASGQLSALGGVLPREDIALVLQMNSLPIGSNIRLNGTTASINRATKQVSEEIQKAQETIDTVFKFLDDTVKAAVNEVNGFIEQIQSLMAYFQCELARSSDDLVSIMKSLNDLITTLNLLSSIVYALAKKEARKVCKSKNNIRQLSNNNSLTDDQLLAKDFLQDYYQKQVDLVNTTDSNLEVLVYEKPVAFGLPKISLLDCSIDDFIKNHTLDAIMDIATQDVLNEEQATRIVIDNMPWESYVIPKITDSNILEEVKNLTELLYQKPTINNELTITDTLVQPFTGTPPSFTSKEGLNTTVKCKTIEDVLSVIDSIKRK